MPSPQGLIRMAPTQPSRSGWTDTAVSLIALGASLLVPPGCVEVGAGPRPQRWLAQAESPVIPVPLPPKAEGDAEGKAEAEGKADAEGKAALHIRAEDTAGEPAAPIPLLIQIDRQADTPPPTLYILNPPLGARLSDPGHSVTVAEDKAVIDITGWNLTDLWITVRPEQAGSFTLAVVALTPPENAGLPTITQATFVLHVRPARAPDPPSARPARPSPPQASAPITPPVALAPVPGPAVAPAPAPPVPALPVPAPPVPVADPSVPRPGTEWAPSVLIARAQRLLQSGDFSAARLILERAADRGDPRAAFLLAQTWDPQVLRNAKVVGLQPDPARARALYDRAAKGGIRDAKSVADALR